MTEGVSMTSFAGADFAETRTKGEPPPAPTEDEIGLLVDRFYGKVRQDAQLAPIFLGAIAEDDWPRHLATMRDFWSSVMRTSGRYHGNPVAAHRQLDGVTPAHFEQWLTLFAETCGEMFEPPLAASFMEKARRIATSLQLAMFFKPEDLRVSGVPRRSPRSIPG